MIIFVSDMFVEDYVGGAELTTEAIIKDSLLPVAKIHSHKITSNFMDKNKDKFWIFGNFTNLQSSCIMFAIKNLSYSILEYDYKFCNYRSMEKHLMIKGEGCNCDKEKMGKLVSIFFKKSVITWFMSESQRQIYLEKFPFLDSNTKVLSSIFSKETLDFIKTLDCSKKNNKWLILNSDSWIKAKDKAVEYANLNDLDYELVWGLEYKKVLQKMAKSKGVIYLPYGGDTCPRFIIEAKLLGCDLKINDNVQHKDEDWFLSQESTYSYLEERTKIFWSVVEKKWNLNTPSSSNSSGNTKFNFVIPFYNAERWLEKCITSVKRQNYKNFECFLIDDLSTDSSYEVASKAAANDDRFHLVKNKEKKYALGNIVSILKTIDSDDEVNIILDGDDWLSSENVLSYLDQEYNNGRTLLTYGNYIYHPQGFMGVEPSMYPDEIIKNNLFRTDQWRASHLRTFKTKLWKELDLEDLKDINGEYYKTAYDQALMLPLLEISGGRFKFVDRIMHTYNRENPLNVDKTKQKMQFETAKEIRRKKPYVSKF